MYIYIDGIYRAMAGDIPNLDFISGLGFLNFVGPASVGWLSDSPYTLFLAFTLVILFFCLSGGAYLSKTRLPRLPAICFQCYLAALVAAPVPLGLAGSNITFAMYYNRFAWGLILLIALFFIPRSNPDRWTYRIEGLFVGIALVLLLYTKLTYVMMAMMLVLFLAAARRLHRISSLWSICVVLSVIIVVELVYPGIHRSYFRDVWEMATVRDSFFRNIYVAIKNNLIFIFVPLGSLILIETTATLKEKGDKRTVFFFCFLLLGCSLILLATNWETFSLPLMFGAFLIAIAPFSQSISAVKLNRSPNRFIAVLLLLGLLPWVLETIERQGAIERFFRLGRLSRYEMKVPYQMREMVIEEGTLNGLDKVRPDGTIQVNFDDFRGLTQRSARQEIFQTQYAYTVARGVKAMEEVFGNHGPGSIYNMDFSNPFSHLLGAPTAKGTYLWHHDHINLSLEQHRPARSVFANVDYIMIPKFPMVMKTTDILHRIYGDYIAANYSCVLEDELWEVWVTSRSKVNNRTDLRDHQAERAQYDQEVVMDRSGDDGNEGLFLEK